MGATVALQKAFVPKFGLDLAGGTTVTLSPVTADGKAPSQESLDRAVTIIRQRVNGTGISDAQVAKSNDNIVIQIPGAGRDEALKLVSTTAELRMRQVLAVAAAANPPAEVPTAAPTPSGSATATPATTAGTPTPAGQGADNGNATPAGRALSKALTAPSPDPSASERAGNHRKAGAGAARANRAKASPSAAAPSPTPTAAPQDAGDPLAGQDTSGIDPALLTEFRNIDCTAKNRGQGAADDPNKQIVACSDDGTARYILDKAAVQGTEISGAQAGTDPTTGEWIVQVDFKSKGASQFADITRRITSLPAPRNQLANVLDGVVIVAPTIEEAIPGGSARISGSFTQTTATELADQLKYGALPLKFQQSSVVSVSSTLGQDQLNGGLISGALGLLVVMIYLLIYYRGLGLIGIASLCVATVFTYLTVDVLSHNAGFRLSLPHIIGLVVSIGITADSFIVYFERIRDEIKEGHRTLRSAVEVAWRRARRTILVADAVMFIAAVVLYFLAVGDVAGFAFAMGLTTLIDIVVVFLFTKPLMSLMGRLRFFSKGHKLSGLDAERMGRTSPAEQTLQEA
ncbi:protein translocase subunit SecD [Microbispora hainanensis]|uniref:Protein translocase subunit SecD n=2 Tax=Streptosporangiaceae TaxID=2004 RepID=A0ABZ1T5U3_9ACTN|nr:protein translocase subunit SecD [Microbispora sp. CL1-1]NJP26492.1 protein translocase subunit SecD [Microbispora sp. CL1-1]TQS12342.1 protein translocase subunit SecD [Microbispora sp. SCL1-1]